MTLDDETNLELRWTSATNPLKSATQREQFLALFDSAGPLRPETVVGKFKGAFDVAKLTPKLVRAGSERFISIVMRGERIPLEYSVMINTETPSLSLRARFALAAFHDQGLCDRIVGLARGLASVIGVEFGRAHDEPDADLSDEHRGAPLNVPEKIDDVYWMTVWGRSLVERAGRDRVLATPAYRVENVDDGAVLLMTRPTPTDARSPDGRRAQARALAYLRPDRIEEDIYAALLARSRKLAPVLNTWDPDIAPLFEQFVNDERVAERPAMTEQFNAFIATPVDEVREPPLPADSDVEDALDDYDDRAEQLIALLHKQVPDMETFEPRVVAGIDYWCWRFSFANYERKHVDADLVPALGAYVALVMVKHLGGTLVPRKKLDESQVVIGGRAYLPFLRARHQLASREDAIDHSMTQFLAVAKRGG